MAETAIQLLSSAQQQSLPVLGIINQNMEQMVQTSQRANEFEVNTRLKAAQLAEQARSTDAQIENIHFDNYIRGQQFEMQKREAPLRYATANLQFQAQKARLDFERQRMNDAQFNEITGLYDERMGYNLLQTESTDQAREYLDLKAKYKTLSSNGQPFNGQQFQKEIDQINGKYTGTTPDGTGWSADKKYLYESINPKLGAAYDLKNPVVAKNRNALASSYLDMQDNQVAAFAGQFGTLYTEEDFGGIGSGRSIYQTNKRTYEDYINQANRLFTNASQLSAEEYPDQRAAMIAQANEFQSIAQKALAQNSKMQTDFAQGNYTSRGEIIPPPEQSNQRPAGPNPSNYTTPSAPTLGVPVPDSSDTQGISIRKNLDDVVTTVTGGSDVNESELRGVDFSWFNENRRSEVDNRTLTNIRTKIEDNIESLGDLGERFNRQKVESLLGKIPGTSQVPISNYLADLITKNYGWDGGQRFPVTNANLSGGDPVKSLGFGPKSSGPIAWLTGEGRKIESYDDIQSLLNSIQSKPEREEARKEIYASLLTAALSNSITVD